MKEEKDPIGLAIKQFSETKKPYDIIVSSDLCDDDIIPIEVLFRTYQEMPELEQLALSKCKGKILDVGAGAGAHAKELMKKSFQVKAIDTSKGAVEYMLSQKIDAEQISFYDLKNQQYDTILCLMNGLGIAGKLSNLENFLSHAKSLLKKGGSLLCDSSDIKYLYEDDEGGYWFDLNSEYYGNFKFQMAYKKEVGPWFDWLYVDFDNLFNACKNVGLKANRIYENDDHYLAEITWA